MKSQIEMVEDVYGLIDVSSVKSLITGLILRYERPNGSDKINIVVGSINLSNLPMQYGVVNVNVHVPNLKNVDFGFGTDAMQPDIETMKGIEKELMSILNGYYSQTEAYHTDCEPGEPIRDNDGSWYLNIRVNYYSAFEENIKNI